MQLTKPGIVLGNAITAAGGFALASRGHIDCRLLATTLVGLCLVIASACVWNNCIDRERDARMARTRHRALVVGKVAPSSAARFAMLLGVLGSSILALYANLLAMCIALFGLLIYVALYSLWKYYSAHATLVGSMAGAAPAVVGYCAVTHSLDVGALLLFVMIALWQMPHFFSIAIYRLEDYAAASIPALPVIRGVSVAKRHTLLYLIAFVFVAGMLTLFGYTGSAYLAAVVLLGAAWLWLCIQGFTSASDALWAQRMFRFSLVTIVMLCLMMALDPSTS